MKESLNKKRVLLPLGKQKRLITKIEKIMSVSEMARLCNRSERTIRDWRREKITADFGCLQKLCKKSGVPFPKAAQLLDRYWYAHKGGQLGGRVLVQKYGRVGGNPEYRKTKWREWWEREGKRMNAKNPILIGKPVQKPTYSANLAEFVGIVLGDGGISKYQVVVTLHITDDKEYSEYVASLLRKLFRTRVGISYRPKSSVVNIVISRIELVNYCTKILGLKIGNKVAQQVDIPNWIKQNKKYSIACVRGLVDTDGSIFTHSYKVNGKWYHYKKFAFTSLSRPMLNSVFKIFEAQG